MGKIKRTVPDALPADLDLGVPVGEELDLSWELINALLDEVRKRIQSLSRTEVIGALERAKHFMLRKYDRDDDAADDEDESFDAGSPS